MKIINQKWWYIRQSKIFTSFGNSTIINKSRKILNSNLVEIFKIDDNKISSDVYDMKTKYYYENSITVTPFTEEQKGILLHFFENNISLLTDILNNKITSQILKPFEQLNIPFFLDKNSLTFKCECRKREVCEHLMAILFIINNYIRDNIFLLFKLRDIKLSDVLNLYYDMEFDDSLISELPENLKGENYSIKETLNNKIDFSIKSFYGEAIDDSNIKQLENNDALQQNRFIYDSINSEFYKEIDILIQFLKN